MSLLGRLQSVDDTTLLDCWNAVSARPSEGIRHSIEQLAPQFGSPEAFELVRTEIIASAPDLCELDQMMAVVLDWGLSVSALELADLVYRRELPYHAVIQVLSAHDDECKKRESFLYTPIAVEDSLWELFREIGICFMITGEPTGIYIRDWDHIRIATLDYHIKLNSTGMSAGQRFTLVRTTERSNDERAFEFESPYFISDAGTRYTFLDATYDTGRILVTVRIEPRGRKSSMTRYSVSKLRAEIGLKRRRRRRHWRSRYSRGLYRRK
jgi:hypothetical protein